MKQHNIIILILSSVCSINSMQLQQRTMQLMRASRLPIQLQRAAFSTRGLGYNGGNSISEIDKSWEKEEKRLASARENKEKVERTADFLRHSRLCANGYLGLSLLGLYVNPGLLPVGMSVLFASYILGTKLWQTHALKKADQELHEALYPFTFKH